MEQAQFGVLEMDWFIASLQPMRWIKVPGGRSRARRGRTLTITQHGIVASSRDFLDKQRLADYFMSFVRSWTAGPYLGEWWPSRLVATAAADCLSKPRPARYAIGRPLVGHRRAAPS